MKEAELLTEILASAVLTTNPARVTAQDFAGAYGGFGFSYGAGNTEAIWVGGGPSTGNDSHEFSGLTFGGFLGHNWQNGRSACGVEAGLEVSDTNGDDSFTGGFGSGTRISSFGHVSGRIGRVNDLGMLYASFGEALADVQLTERETVAGSIAGKTTSAMSERGWVWGRKYRFDRDSFGSRCPIRVLIRRAGTSSPSL